MARLHGAAEHRLVGAALSGRQHEASPGSGSLLVQNPSKATIVNQARLDFVRGNDVCIQCHSQGQPRKNPVAWQYYDWPVGVAVGLDLKDFWAPEEHQLGEITFMHYADRAALAGRTAYQHRGRAHPSCGRQRRQ